MVAGWRGPCPVQGYQRQGPCQWPSTYKHDPTNVLPGTPVPGIGMELSLLRHFASRKKEALAVVSSPSYALRNTPSTLPRYSLALACFAVSSYQRGPRDPTLDRRRLTSRIGVKIITIMSDVGPPASSPHLPLKSLNPPTDI